MDLIQFAAVFSCFFAICLTEFQTPNVTPCQSLCSSTFQGDDGNFCYRGCRLMSVLDMINGPESSLAELSNACLQACSEAYGLTNASACAFGCQSQLPGIEDKRKQLAQFTLNLHDEAEDPLFSLMSRLSDYSRRMMDCMMDQMNHHVSFGWMVISSSETILPNGGRVVIIRGIPMRIVEQPMASIERKTSNYVETNLASADSASSLELKNPVPSDPTDPVDSFVFGDSITMERQVPSDWLTCLSIKTGLSKMSILFLIFTLLILLLWFVIGLLFPSASRVANQAGGHPKLSIYGDQEYLIPIETKSATFYADHQKCATYLAPPLPVKMQEI